MKLIIKVLFWTAMIMGLCQTVLADELVDIPTRPGVKQRFLFMSPPKPTAAVLLFAGGDGGLQISSDGSIKSLAGNFLVRSRSMFVENGLAVAIIDAPSDRHNLAGFRQSQEHAMDIEFVISWMKKRTAVPVWLVGTSRGTQSVAAIAISLAGKTGPDGIVLTSTILSDPKSRPVLMMDIGKINVPVLVVHHEKDGCKHCEPSMLNSLMSKLTSSPRKELITFRGGQDRGDPCEAFAYHGFNGIEKEVVRKIAAWITSRK